MTLSELIRAEEGFLAHKVAPRPQIQPELAKKGPAKLNPKIAHSAQPGDPKAVIAATNHYIFIKWP